MISKIDFKVLLFENREMHNSLYNENKRPMGHIAHLRKQFKSINIYDYHNVDEEKKKNIIYFMRIEWSFI